MASKLLVKLQSIFGGALAPSGNIAQPGSTLAGLPVYSNDPATLQALAAWVNGYAAQLINAPGGLSSPVMEELNAILFVLSYQIAYLKQAGLAEWDPTVNYYTGSWAQDSAGVPYVSKTDNNINNPLTDTNNWKTFASTLAGASNGQIKAWVNFDGRTGAIDSSFGIYSVARTGSGIYLITFTTAFSGPNTYGWSGSCGTRPGALFSSGDDNFLCGNVRGYTPVRSAAYCQIFCFDRVLSANEDSSQISLVFFGT